MKKKLVIYSLTSLLAITPVASVFAADTSTVAESTTINSQTTVAGTTDNGSVENQQDPAEDKQAAENKQAAEAKQLIDQYMEQLMETVQAEDGELNQEKLQETLTEMLQQMNQDEEVKQAVSEEQVKQLVKQNLEMEIKSGQASEEQIELLVSLKLDDEDQTGALATVEEALAKNSASDKLYSLLSEVYKMQGDTEDVKVYVGGKQPNFDVMPFIENGRTMIPLRAVSEALGADVTWSEETQTVVISKEGITIELPIGSQTIKVNGVEYTIDAPARVTGDRTIVPVRFISEFLGHQVEFDAETNLVIVK